MKNFQRRVVGGLSDAVQGGRHGAIVRQNEDHSRHGYRRRYRRRVGAGFRRLTRIRALGVTIAHGNTPARAPIALKMLHLAGLDAPARRHRTQDQRRLFSSIHLGGDFTAKRSDPGNPPPILIVEQVKNIRARVTLLAVGPLQNVADALRREPQLGKYVKRRPDERLAFTHGWQPDQTHPRMERLSIDRRCPARVWRRPAADDRPASIPPPTSN